MKQNSSQSGSRHEEGFLLLGVLFMILLIMMALAIAAPKMAESIRRDKEIETVHRGKQYARAIRIYYAKYGRYPNTIDQLGSQIRRGAVAPRRATGSAHSLAQRPVGSRSAGCTDPPDAPATAAR